MVTFFKNSLNDQARRKFFTTRAGPVSSLLSCLKVKDFEQLDMVIRNGPQKLDVILATGGRMPEIDSSWSIIFFSFRQRPSHICIIALKRSPCYDRIKPSKFQFRHEKINKIQLLGDETKKFRSDLTLLICCTFLLHVESVQDIFVS